MLKDELHKFLKVAFFMAVGTLGVFAVVCEMASSRPEAPQPAPSPAVRYQPLEQEYEYRRTTDWDLGRRGYIPLPTEERGTIRMRRLP